MNLPVPPGSLAARRLASPVFGRLPFLTNVLTSGSDEDLNALRSAWPNFEVLIFFHFLIVLLIQTLGYDRPISFL